MKLSLSLPLCLALACLVALARGQAAIIPWTGAVAAQSSGWNGNTFPANLGIDGNVNTYTHTISGNWDSIPVPVWQVRLPTSVTISRVQIFNRVGCCPYRLANVRVELIQVTDPNALSNFAPGSGGTVVFASPLLNPNNALNGPVNFDTSPPTPVTANFIRIWRDQKFNDPLSTNSDRMVLSMGEVILFGNDFEIENCGTRTGNCPRYCLGIGQRSGCSGCVATEGTCEWCVDPANQAEGVCVYNGPGGTCGNPKMAPARIATWVNGNAMCPSKNVTDEARVKGKQIQERIRNGAFSHSFESRFCQFPTEPYTVDRWSAAFTGTSAADTESTPCNEVNTRFGLTFGAIDLLDLKSKLSAGRCRTQTDPLATESGRECMRSMQAAYCSYACPAFGVKKFRACFNMKKLFAVCAPWTNGPNVRLGSDTRGLDNGCPLDPNNLPKANSIDTLCDSEGTAIEPSGLFEETFGMYKTKPQSTSQTLPS